MLVVSAIVVLVVVSVAGALADPYTRAVLAAELRLRSVPEVEDRLAGLPPHEAEQVIGELSERGLRRLDDSQLLTRAEILRRMAIASDDRTCATFAFGQPTLDQLRDASSGLGQGEIDTLVQLGVEAAIAEARGAPPAQTVSDEDAVRAFEALTDRLKPDDATRWGRVLDAPEPRRLPDAEQCWFLRTLLGEIPAMPEPHRHVLLRLTVEQDTSEPPASI